MNLILMKPDSYSYMDNMLGVQFVLAYFAIGLWA